MRIPCRVLEPQIKLCNCSDQNFLAPITTQVGTVLTGTQAVWTGADASGEAVSKCSNWTITTGTTNAGNLNGTGTGWLSFGTVSCASSQRFYRVGDLQRGFVTHLLDFNDLTPGTTVPYIYDGGTGATPRFGPGWNVANDTLGGQLGVDSNYINFTEATTTLDWARSLSVDIPAMTAGPNGLAGLFIEAKTTGGTVIDSEAIPPLNPGETRFASQIKLYASSASAGYRFTRIENPNIAKAPAPIDNLRLTEPD